VFCYRYLCRIGLEKCTTGSSQIIVTAIHIIFSAAASTVVIVFLSGRSLGCCSLGIFTSVLNFDSNEFKLLDAGCNRDSCNFQWVGTGCNDTSEKWRKTVVQPAVQYVIRQLFSYASDVFNLELLHESDRDCENGGPCTSPYPAAIDALD
jgi:hypothetical protein